VVQIID